MNYTIKGIDSELWKEVKILAVRQGLTVKALILKLLKEALKNAK